MNFNVFTGRLNSKARSDKPASGQHAFMDQTKELGGKARLVSHAIVGPNSGHVMTKSRPSPKIILTSKVLAPSVNLCKSLR